MEVAGVFVGSIALFITVILIATLLQTSTGFGFSIMATPFLLLLFDVREAVQINLLLSLVISFALIWKIRSDIDKHVLQRFAAGSIVGLPIGIGFFLVMNTSYLKLAVSILILVLTLLLIWHYRMRQTVKRDYMVGGASGALTTSIGMPGPPVLLYFAGTGVTKETLRATTLAFYLVVYAASLMVQIAFAGTSDIVWKSSAQALPLVGIGLVAGQWMFRIISKQLFRLLTYVLLLFTGLYLLWEQLQVIFS